MLRFRVPALAAAVLVLAGHPAFAQEETIDFTARGGVKDLIGRVDALEAQPDADTLGNLGCANGEVAKFNGVSWICAADEDISAADCPDGQVLVSDGSGTGGTCAPGPRAFKYVFVTSWVFSGDLGGVFGNPPFGALTSATPGAHTICNRLVEGAGLPGTYKAWIASGANNPNSMFIKSSVPYVLPDGITRVAVSYDDLVDPVTPLDHEINMDETGTLILPPPAGTLLVWTNVAADGSSNSLPDCGSWKDNSGFSNTGSLGIVSPASLDSSWTDYDVRVCEERFHLYCFEQ